MNGRERSTVRSGGRFDVSPAVDHAFAAPAARLEHCVCGGRIKVNRGDSIPAAVVLHNASVLHAEWRWRQAMAETA